MRIILKVLGESSYLVMQELWGNKLRTFLSILGVTIGIFCIISVLSAVDSLERKLQADLNKLGSNILYVQKWPWAFGGEEYAWWEYINRPYPTYAEYRFLTEKLKKASTVSIEGFLNGKIVKHRSSFVRNVDVLAVSGEFDIMYEMNFQKGRFFSSKESNNGSNVCILGHDIAEALFSPNIDPVGKMVWVLGNKCKVLGVVEKEGQSMIDFSFDDYIIIPYNYLRRIRDVRDRNMENVILVKAREGVKSAEIKDEIIPLMRSQRRLKPKEEDDFAVNEVTMASTALQQTFGAFNLIGFLIGGFSVLVGGFGIANIMFVSVKERTPIIGIKKSLGAKNYFIMLEFLIEAVILAIIGCLIGLLLVYLAMLAARHLLDFEFILSLNNVLIGMLISSIIGLVFGIFPAFVASRLNPVEAMRST